MSIFKRLFPRKPAPTVAVAKTIDQMNAYEVLQLVKSDSDGVSAQSFIHIYPRLYDIAWFDHHVPEAERKFAAEMAEAIRYDITAGLSHDAEALEAFLEGADAHADSVQFYGVGSLQWLTEEHNVTAAQLIPFIVQRQWTDLLPTFLTMMDDDVLNDIRAEVLNELVWARRADQSQSDADVIYELAIRPDRSVEILLKTDELRIARNLPHDRSAVEKLTATFMKR
jgi:hypothetical protein